MKGTFQVRTARPADLGAIDAMLKASYPILLKPDYPPSTLVTAVPLISRANPKLLASGTYFVAVDGATVLGAGGWSASPPPGIPEQRRVGHIRHVVTDHRHVRRGVGGALMEQVFNTSRAAGITRLECLSTRTAVPFYAANGFVARKEVMIPLRPGIDFPAVFMERSLKA